MSNLNITWPWPAKFLTPVGVFTKQISTTETCYQFNNFVGSFVDIANHWKYYFICPCKFGQILPLYLFRTWQPRHWLCTEGKEMVILNILNSYASQALPTNSHCLFHQKTSVTQNVNYFLGALRKLIEINHLYKKVSLQDKY